jgi:exonuclease SbcC
VRKYVQEREYIADEYKKTKVRLNQNEAQQQPLLEQQQQFEQSRQISIQQQSCSEQLQQSAQFSALDKGLNAHLQQLKQFIQQYQKVEQNLGSIQQAQSKLEQDQIVLNEQFKNLAHHNRLKTKLSRNKNRESNNRLD